MKHMRLLNQSNAYYERADTVAINAVTYLPTPASPTANSVVSAKSYQQTHHRASIAYQLNIDEEMKERNEKLNKYVLIK